MARDHPFNNHSPKIIMGMASQSSSKIRATIAILVLLVVVFQSLLLSWLTIGDMTIKPESKQSTTTSISTVENNNTNNNYNRIPIAVVPPEPLETIQFCAEKCRYLPEMCRTGLHRNHLSLPAPTCLNYSLTVPNDLYWSDLNSANKTLSTKRDLDTVNLIAWIAGQARSRRIAGSKTSIGTISSSTGRSSSVAPSPLLCETVPTKYSKPMMFPEEFEFVVKLMGNARPRTYLEWGYVDFIIVCFCVLFYFNLFY